MLRYYMTPETRQSLIEESNRQIAMRAIASAARGRRLPAAAGSRFAEDAEAVDAAETDWPETDWPEAVSESAFARLVADLEATSQTPASAARSG
jgi:hypothetical protein